MIDRPMRILQVSTALGLGGAESVAHSLSLSYGDSGHDSTLAVGHKLIPSSTVVAIDNDSHRSAWARLWLDVGTALSKPLRRVKGVGRSIDLLAIGIGQPRRALESWLGHEALDFPGSWHLLDLTPRRPDILHMHNLHGYYFDLRALPWLSNQLPVVLTLHDAWLLSGHCAHSFDCERWETGCGQCPDLTIYPAIRRDATAYNWQYKKELYARSSLYVATPCQWLMQKVKRSMLAQSIVEAKIIPYGIDQAVFRPAVTRAVRAALEIPQEALVLLFAATSIRQSMWRDYHAMRAAVSMVSERLPGMPVTFVALGEDAPAEQIGDAQIRFVPFQSEPEAVASYYQAADVYLHAARVDTFPNTVLEALSCGTPVVATAVGGIPEQVRGLAKAVDRPFHTISNPNSYELNKATGILVPPGDSATLAEAVITLLSDQDLLRRLGENAMLDARRRFGQERQVEEYLAWYQKITRTHSTQSGTRDLAEA